VQDVSAETQLRRDAAANRERILDAARRVFADRGLEASMDEVARAAGVGAGTLYRRFPTKEALLDAILGGLLDRFRAFAEEALGRDDAFGGLELLLERSVGLQLENRAFLEVLALRLREEPQLARARERIRPLVEQLVSRAQEQGTLRRDLAAVDVTVLLWQLGRVVECTGAFTSELWRRYLALTLDGLRSEAARPLPHPPPTPAELDRLMAETAERRGLHGRRPPRRDMELPASDRDGA
jgi:AcrR family transcriptional regulator